MKYISVKDFCYLYIEPMEDMVIWDIDNEVELFIGTFKDAMVSEYADFDVETFGIEHDKICINICVNI